jgi:drug/metabolite transporter (DMT)-like permease
VILTIRRRWRPMFAAFQETASMRFIVIGSLFGPFLGVASSLLALQYTEVGIATTIAQLNVILIIPFSILLFKETVSLKEILGSVVAIAGVALLFLA